MIFSGLQGSVWSVIKSIGPTDIIDMAVIAVAVYWLIGFISRTKASQIVRILLIFVGLYFVSEVLKLKTVTFLLQNFVQVGVLAVIILFQPEIRHMFEQLSNTNIFKYFQSSRKFTGYAQTDDLQKSIASICDSVERMSAEKTGALIVMEKFSPLTNIKRTGTAVNGDITSELIGTIFYEGSPLHDGAVLISENRVAYAGCVLPLSDNYEISKEYGTRHRAALGLSEASDALCIVVSEETGKIRLAQHGEFESEYDREKLYDKLVSEFITPLLDSENVQKKSILRRMRSENK